MAGHVDKRTEPRWDDIGSDGRPCLSRWCTAGKSVPREKHHLALVRVNEELPGKDCAASAADWPFAPCADLVAASTGSDVMWHQHENTLAFHIKNLF